LITSFYRIPSIKILLILLLVACQNSVGSSNQTLTETVIPPTPTDIYGPNGINSLQTIIDDMKAPHESRPMGAPIWAEWSRRPCLEYGNDPQGFTALLAWGQLYVDRRGNPATNTRVQIRDIKAYVLSKSDGKWHLVQDSRLVDGAAFREDYKDDINKPADIRYEEDGSISVTAGDGYNFHFWTAGGRATIDPNDIAGIFATVQARLIVDDPNLPDDRDIARYLLDMGADYWKDLDAEWDYWTTNKQVGAGKFKFVGVEWKAFNMITLSEEEIRANPPPLD
jgi:hypothetical protein